MVSHNLGEAAELFSALGDPTRLLLVTTLAENGGESITGLSQGVDISRQAVTKHLKVLSGAGLVEGRRSGREHVWEFRPTRLDDARSFLNRIDAEWDGALDRLRSFVEGDGDR